MMLFIRMEIVCSVISCLAFHTPSLVNAAEVSNHTPPASETAPIAAGNQHAEQLMCTYMRLHPRTHGTWTIVWVFSILCTLCVVLYVSTALFCRFNVLCPWCTVQGSKKSQSTAISWYFQESWHDKNNIIWTHPPQQVADSFNIKNSFPLWMKRTLDNENKACVPPCVDQTQTFVTRSRQKVNESKPKRC